MAKGARTKQDETARGQRQLALRSVRIVVLSGLSVLLAVAALGALRFFAIPADTVGQAGLGLAFTRFWISLGVIALFFMALSTAAAWFSARAVSDDVAFLTRRVRAIAERGDLGAPTSIRSLDELGSLTRAFEGLRRSQLSQIVLERAALQKAQEADQQRSEFFSTVSHELRTPLNAILGFTGVLIGEIEGPLTPGQREDLELVRASGEHLSELFSNVLDLSVLTSGQAILKREPVRIGALIAEVCSLLEAQRQKKQVAIVADVPEDLPPLHGDPTRLRQILMNLGTNALKFTERGEVRVSARAPGEQLLICVRDTGIGIAAQELPRLFEEFSQLGSRDGRRGSGLGLSIVKRLVELHGGLVSVESERGQGSTFSVQIPLSAGEEQQAV